MDQIDKRLLKSNEWVWNNGLLIPKWTLAKPTKNNFDKEVIAYGTFRDLFPDDQNSEELIKSSYSSFWVYDIMEVLCKLNYIVSFTQLKESTKEDLALAYTFLEDTAVYNFLNHKETRKIITRQQLLANIRLALLYASETQTGKTVLGNEKEFGKLIYRVTDFLESYTRFKDEKNPTDTERKKLYLTMARNLFFNESSTFVLALCRYWYIYNVVAYRKQNRKAKIKHQFKQATKIEYNNLLAVGFAIWGFYCESSKSQRLSKPEEFLFNENYFRNTDKKVRRGLTNALSMIAGDFSYYRNEFSKIKTTEEHYFLNPFWKKPLFKNSHGAYSIIDSKFLEERITEGAYWMVFDELIEGNASKKELSDFGSQWGCIFEDYVNELVASAYSKKPKRVLFEKNGDKTGGVDVIIIYPETLVLIEVTTKKVRYDEWIRGDYSAVKDSFYRIFIKDERSKGRVVKLYEAVQKIKSAKLQIDGCDMKNIKRILPIVVFEKSPPMYNRLWHIYNTFLKENGIKDQVFLDDLDFWNIEELEMVLADVQHGKTIPEIINEKDKVGFFKNSVRNFYIMYRKHFDRHSVLEDVFKKMTAGFTRILFNK